MPYVEHHGFPGIHPVLRDHRTPASVQDFNRHPANYFFVECDCYLILERIRIDLQLFLPIGDAVQDNGMLNIILVGPNGGLTFSSSEGGNKPELRVVTLRGGLATEEMTTMTAKVETSTTNWQEQLKVYPNPFEDNIAVAFEEEITGGMTVEVLDRNGRPVFSESRMNPGKSLTLDIRNLNMQPGMYFLKVKVNGIETRTLRIFKR